MRLRLLRPNHQRRRSRAWDTAQATSNTRQRGGNAFQKLIGRCRLPCVRCGGDTASLASDLQYHSLLATPVYLPQRLGGDGQGETSDGSEVEEEGRGDGKMEEEEEEDADLSMFSQGWDNTRRLYLPRNRNLQESQEVYGEPIAIDTGSHASMHGLQEEARHTRTQPSHLTRINTSFIPLAFNSHRSWLDRIHLGNSVSSSDDFSHLLEAEDNGWADVDQADESSEEDAEEGPRPNGAPSPNSSMDLNPTEVNRTTGVGGGEQNGNTIAHTIQLDYDTLPPSQNTLWTGQGSTNSSSSDGDRVDMLSSTDGSQSSIPLDFLDYFDFEVAAAAPDHSVVSRTGSGSIWSSGDHPPETLPAEQTSSEEEEVTMPESLRFLFQPLLTASHTNTTPTTATAIVSEPQTTQTATSVSRPSLAGYANQPGSPSNSQSSSLVNLQQNWYIYDPRLHPLHHRQERLHVEMRWRGVQTALSLPAMIGPPDYDDLSSHHGDNHDNSAAAQEPPPPYADGHDNYPQVDTAPPPTYDEAVLESLFTDREARQSYRAESRDSNLSPGTSLPINCNLGDTDADDLDTNVIVSTTCEGDTDELPATMSAQSALFDTNDNPRRRQGVSPTQALQAGFLCSLGRPAVAWNSQRWGETGNQSNFGINCRLQGVDGARF